MLLLLGLFGDQLDDLFVDLFGGLFGGLYGVMFGNLYGDITFLVICLVTYSLICFVTWFQSLGSNSLGSISEQSLWQSCSKVCFDQQVLCF